MTATTSPARGAATSPATIPAQGYAAFDPTSPLGPFSFDAPRAAARATSQIDILFCGVCHSDLHTVRSEWQRHDRIPACPATRSSAASTRSARR